MKATATVVKAQDGLVIVRIRGVDRELVGRHYDLQPGDAVEVERGANYVYRRIVLV